MTKTSKHYRKAWNGGVRPVVSHADMPDWRRDPADDCKDAGERMTLDECDEMLNAIQAILDQHLLNGATHCEMMRWKLRAIAAQFGGAMTEILDRLRKVKAEFAHKHAWGWNDDVGDIMRDAIAAIEQRDAEIARLREALTEISRDAWAMEAQTDEPLTGTYAKRVGEQVDAALAAQRET